MAPPLCALLIVVDVLLSFVVFCEGVGQLPKSLSGYVLSYGVCDYVVRGRPPYGHVLFAGVRDTHEHLLQTFVFPCQRAACARQANTQDSSGILIRNRFN